MKIGDAAREKLLPVAQRVFWWDDRAAWLDLPVRFVAQVMMFGSDEDKATVAELLGEDAFREVLQNPPPGVFNVETWSAWHRRFKLPVRPLPTRTFTEAEEDTTLGNAIYSGKEEWKAEPGNRYTPEELREMEKNWIIDIRPPTEAEVQARRGVIKARAELKQEEGGHISADEAAARSKLSKAELLGRFKARRVLGWREKNGARFPVWQFSETGGLLRGFEQALELLNAKPSYDVWAKLLFFLNRRHSLGGERPLDLLRAGRSKEVLDLAGADD